MLKRQFKESDAEVIDWIVIYLKTGDKHYWGQIFEKYQRKIYARCFSIVNNSEDAKDLTIEAFMKAFENISKFDLKRSFFSWLYQIATNLCIDHIRRKKILQFTPIEDNLVIDNPENITADIERKELGNKIKKTLEKLKGPQRRCFCLFYIQKKSYQEISEFTGYTSNEVRSFIQNGRRNFRAIIEKMSPF